MGKSAKAKQARKRAKRKKIIITVVCIVVAAIIIAALVFYFLNQQNADQQGSERVYELGDGAVTLNDDGSFNAHLFHGDSYIGTYIEDIQGDVTIISFNYDGINATGWIIGNGLTLPDEWDDGHGHGHEFILR